MSAKEILFLLLRHELYGESVPEGTKENISPEILLKLYKLAKAHEITAFVAYALTELGVIGSDEVSLKFSKQMMIAKHQYECMRYEISEISRVLSEAKIKHIFLKGSVLREYYPTPWMRTSCDIDVLVDKSVLDSAIATLSDKLSYTDEKRTLYDVCMHAPSKVHVELHFGLMQSETLDKGEHILDEVWERSNPSQTSEYLYEMSDEMFYYHHIIHMMKHVMHGGCGIRPFVDLWILNNRMEFDAVKRDELLSLGGIKKFADAARALMSVWFCEDEHTDKTKMMENYIMYGGVYGNAANKVAVGQSKKSGKFSYAISRIFPSYKFMKISYPILEKHKWLLPFMYIRRICRVIKRGRLSTSVAELKYNNDITAEQRELTQMFLSDIGL